MAKPINILNIQDAIAAGIKANERANNGFIMTSSDQKAFNNMASSDYSVASYLGSVKGDNDFVWEIDKWGDTQYKVAD